MEIFRRLFGSNPNEGNPDFLDRLRKQRKDAEDVLTRQQEAERLRILAVEEREQVRLATLRLIKEEDLRVEPLRAAALKDSIVPGLLKELSQLLGKELSSHKTDTLYIELESADLPDNPHSYSTLELEDDNPHGYSVARRGSRVLFASGIKDGSVQIGRTTLNPQDAQNYQKVNVALEKAYRDPMLIGIKYTYEYSDDGGTA